MNPHPLSNLPPSAKLRAVSLSNGLKGEGYNDLPLFSLPARSRFGKGRGKGKGDSGRKEGRVIEDQAEGRMNEEDIAGK